MPIGSSPSTGVELKLLLLFTAEQDGKEIKLPADTVIIAAGLAPKLDEAAKLELRFGSAESHFGLRLKKR